MRMSHAFLQSSEVDGRLGSPARPIAEEDARSSSILVAGGRSRRTGLLEVLPGARSARPETPRGYLRAAMPLGLFIDSSRKVDLESLTETLSHVGTQGESFLILGEAGIGKTTTVNYWRRPSVHVCLRQTHRTSFPDSSGLASEQQMTSLRHWTWRFRRNRFRPRRRPVIQPS